MRRAELGHWTTGDRHGKGLAGLGPTEHLADVVTQLLLCDVAYGEDGSSTATMVCSERRGVLVASLRLPHVAVVVANPPGGHNLCRDRVSAEGCGA